MRVPIYRHVPALLNRVVMFVVEQVLMNVFLESATGVLPASPKELAKLQGNSLHWTIASPSPTQTSIFD